jgi:hypothetical protein
MVRPLDRGLLVGLMLATAGTAEFFDGAPRNDFDE